MYIKENKPFMEGVYSNGTQPEEKAQFDAEIRKKALVATSIRQG